MQACSNMESITLNNNNKLMESNNQIIFPSDFENKVGKTLYSQIENLSIKDNVTVETVAEQIATNLNEGNKDLIYKIVRAIGIEQALKFYDDTRQIELSGGIKYKDGSRRKTPGGVFFYLIQNDKSILDENLKQIFTEESHKKNKLRKDQIKEERKKRTEELRARIIEEGLLCLGSQENEV